MLRDGARLPMTAVAVSARPVVAVIGNERPAEAAIAAAAKVNEKSNKVFSSRRTA
jgi:hypothetical protein